MGNQCQCIRAFELVRHRLCCSDHSNGTGWEIHPVSRQVPRTFPFNVTLSQNVPSLLFFWGKLLLFSLAGDGF